MLIEHTSRSTEDKPKIYICDGALRRSAGCFNQRSLISQPAQYVSHHPHQTIQVNQSQHNPKSQRCLENQRRTEASQSQQSTVYGQPLTSVLVPKCMDCINQSLCQNSAPFDHALTRVNADQTCGGNPSCIENVFFLLPRVNRRFASK